MTIACGCGKSNKSEPTGDPAPNLQAKLDELAKSHAAPAGDRFATAPALDVPPGEVIARASYSISRNRSS